MRLLPVIVYSKTTEISKLKMLSLPPAIFTYAMSNTYLLIMCVYLAGGRDIGHAKTGFAPDTSRDVSLSQFLLTGSGT
jgi:hypothetical protein